MGRPRAKGFPFFSLDSDIFISDNNIRALLGKWGADGIAFYIYILCEAYRQNGYYADYNNNFADCAALTLKMSVEKIGLMLNYLLNQSLLDSKLFRSVKVLTSHGIQLRFQTMSKGRGAKNKILVDSNLWLLNEEETESYISFTQNSSYSKKNYSKSEKNGSYSKKNPIKRKERKIKENKEKEEALSAAVSDAYESNIGIISPSIYHKLLEWQTKADESLILYAIEQAVEYNRKSWAYINAILDTQFNNGNTSESDVTSKPKSKFHNFEQRDIDFNEIEDEYFDSIKKGDDSSG